MTLLEISISTALMTLVFVGVFLIVDKGMRFYRLNSDANDTQRGILSFMSRLNLTMQNTRPNLIFIDSVTPAPTSGDFDYGVSRGIAYATPFDPQGMASFDVNKALYWQGYGCFYVDDQRSLRQVVKTNQQLTVPGRETTSPPAPPLTAPPMTPANFMHTNEGILLAKNVTKLTFYRQDVHLPQQKQRFYSVTIEAGKRGDPLGYWLQLSTSFYPRN